MDGACCGPGYASPSEAIKAPREKLLYTIAIHYVTLTVWTRDGRSASREIRFMVTACEDCGTEG